MNEIIENDIYQIRKALEGFSREDFHTMSSFYHCDGFPDGCCGDSSDLLGLYLLNNHSLESDYVCGCGLPWNSEQTHAWVVCDEYIIDITADQFDYACHGISEIPRLPPVIIKKRSYFHEIFNEYTRRSFSKNGLAKNGIPALLSKIMASINAAGKDNINLGR